MMKEGIRGLRPSYKDNQPRLRTSVGVAQAAIEFKMIELKQVQSTIFHVNAPSAKQPLDCYFLCSC